MSARRAFVEVTFDVTHEGQRRLNWVRELTISARKSGDGAAAVILGTIKPFSGSKRVPERAAARSREPVTRIRRQSEVYSP
jgi:hypothetical protein